MKSLASMRGKDRWGQEMGGTGQEGEGMKEL